MPECRPNGGTTCCSCQALHAGGLEQLVQSVKRGRLLQAAMLVGRAHQALAKLRVRVDNLLSKRMLTIAFSRAHAKWL